jgi:hypothetical protein
VSSNYPQVSGASLNASLRAGLLSPPRSTAARQIMDGFESPLGLPPDSLSLLPTSLGSLGSDPLLNESPPQFDTPPSLSFASLGAPSQQQQQQIDIEYCDSRSRLYNFEARPPPLRRPEAVCRLPSAATLPPTAVCARWRGVTLQKS